MGLIRRQAGLLLFIVATVVSLAIGELGARWLLGERLRRPGDEYSLLYRYDDQLGWFPVANDTRPFFGSRLVRVHHNADGFRDVDHGPTDRPRIAFVGDSFVWGYDAESEERFTEQLQRQHPEWEILNLGVSGYGTDQEYLLVRRFLDRYRPQLIILVFTFNDRRDNSVNLQFGCYKPYFERAGGREGLELRGVPVPRAPGHVFREHPGIFWSYLARGLLSAGSRLWLPKPVEVRDPTHKLVRTLRDFVEQRGCAFAVATVQPGLEFKRFCRNEGIESIVVHGEQYPRLGRHWTPAGNAAVALQLSGFLQAHAARWGLDRARAAARVSENAQTGRRTE